MKYLRNAKCCFVYHYYYYYLVLLSFPRTPRVVYFASCAVEKCLPGTPTPSLSTSRISKDSFPLESSSWHAIYSINPPFDRRLRRGERGRQCGTTSRHVLVPIPSPPALESFTPFFFWRSFLDCQEFIHPLV